MLTIVRVGPKQICRGDKCRQCGKAVKVGHVVAYCKTQAFAPPRFTIHVSCMAALVEKAPTPLPILQAEELMQRMLESGSVWV